MNNKFMKPFLLLAMLAVGLVSCSPDDGTSGEPSNPAPYLEVAIDVDGVALFDYNEEVVYNILTNTDDIVVSGLPDGWKARVYIQSNGYNGLSIKSPRETDNHLPAGTIEITAYDVVQRELKATMEVSLDYDMTFDDSNFENCLMTDYPELQNAAGDKISALKASRYAGALNLSGKGITSLKGIEVFRDLTSLDCSSNQLTGNFDLSKNKKLETLDCSGNQIAELWLDKNSALKTLDCSNNLLTALDLSENSSLVQVTCADNASLRTIIFKSSSDFEVLNCNNCNLTELSLASCPKLKELDCRDNKLSTLSFKYNSSLNKLICSGNKLSSVDISSCDGLVDFDISAQDLTAGAVISVKLWSGLDLTDIPSTWIYDSDVVWE